MAKESQTKKVVKDDMCKKDLSVEEVSNKGKMEDDDKLQQPQVKGAGQEDDDDDIVVIRT